MREAGLPESGFSPFKQALNHPSDGYQKAISSKHRGTSTLVRTCTDIRDNCAPRLQLLAAGYRVCGTVWSKANAE